MIGTIYKLTSPSGKCYIGQTTNITDRIRKFHNPNSRYAGTKIKRAFIKYGRDNFKYEIIETIEDIDKYSLRQRLDVLEIYYIGLYDSYKNGYNMTLGGSGSKGCFQTEESKKIISEKALGRNGTFKGLKHSNKTRKRLSELAKLRVGDKNPFFGRHHDREAKLKIQQANGKPVEQLDSNTNEVLAEYPSARDAARHFGKERANSEILKVCNCYVSPSGKHYKTALGYKWRFKESSTTSKS